jgi:hypothetical protein
MGNVPAPRPLRIPIPVPVFKYPEIWRLEGEIKILNSRIADKNWLIGVKQTALNEMTNLKNKLNDDAERNRQEIERLTSERDALINQKADLENQLADIKRSTDLANAQTKLSTTTNAGLAIDYARLTVDTNEINKNLFNSIQSQNSLLLKSLSNTNSIHRTNDQKAFYQREQMNFINIINFSLLIIYFILVLVCLGILYYKPSITLYKKLFYMICLVIYPFSIMYIEFLIYFFAYFLIRMISFDRLFETTS